MELLVEYREQLYHHGAVFIQHFQENFSHWEPQFLQISKLGDPGMAFTLYFPLIVAINQSTGILFLWTFVLSEWINHVGKWLLAGQRPYWWVKEHNSTIHVRQTPLTCETGPGEPSGHSQAAAVIWFYLILTITDGLSGGPREKTKSWIGRLLVQLMSLVTYLSLQSGMVLSRIYIGAHFPHQCVMGLVVGWIAIWLMRCLPIPRRQLMLSAVTACILPLTAVGTYLVLRHNNFDPDWSLRLAQRWCQRPKEWIHLDTTPFYAMARYSGTALGILIYCFVTSNSRQHHGQKLRVPDHDNSLVPLGIRLVTALLLGWASSKVHALVIPRDLGQPVFYACEIILNMAATYSIALLPHFLSSRLIPTTYPSVDKQK